VQIVFAKSLTKKKGSELQKERISGKRGLHLPNPSQPLMISCRNYRSIQNFLVLDGWGWMSQNLLSKQTKGSSIGI
jgi:hypothetical protein